MKAEIRLSFLSQSYFLSEADDTCFLFFIWSRWYLFFFSCRFLPTL